jgi:hypothetical protein
MPNFDGLMGLVLGNVTVWKAAEGHSQGVEARVRTAKIVAQTALVDIFASVSVVRQLSPRSFVATALVTAVSVSESGHARAVTVAQKTLVAI